MNSIIKYMAEIASDLFDFIYLFVDNVLESEDESEDE